MLALEFPGSRHLVASLDHAVHHDQTADIANALRDTLCELIRDPTVKLPECVFESSCDHYCRRELYRSNDLGYSVIAMTWGPGQGTQIHDHAGMWCVEGVWYGSLEITPYELVERDGERFRFESRGTMNVGPGSAGSLIPPHEYHTIRNPSADSISVTLHIYRGPMTQCSVFCPIADPNGVGLMKATPTAASWYARDQRSLSLDSTH